MKEKTLVATLPAYLNAISRKGVHVVTVNDYLARGYGMDGSAVHGVGSDGRRDPGGHARIRRWPTTSTGLRCNITYGTNNEFGFDYLRDNMRQAARGDERYPKAYINKCKAS